MPSRNSERAKGRPIDLDPGAAPIAGTSSSQTKKRKRTQQNERGDGGSKGEQEGGGGDPLSAGTNASPPAGDQPDGEEAEPHVQALSHKEQRKRRKLEKKLAAAGIAPGVVAPNTPLAGSKPTGSSTGETVFTTSKRSRHGVWVGNLYFATTPQELVQFFSECGTIVRCHMPAGRKAGEANKGFAYVDFETSEAADAAVGLSEGHLGGRRLLIKRSSDFEGRPAAKDGAAGPPGTSMSKSARKILERQKQPAAPCLFMGNLGFAATKESILEMFTAHHEAAAAWKTKHPVNKTPKKEDPAGASDSSASSEPVPSPGGPASDAEDPANEDTLGIRQVRVGTFEDSGKCKGWAFVDFRSIAQATTALINIRNHTLDGRALVVEYASADAVRRGGGPGPRPGREGLRKVHKATGENDAADASQPARKPKSPRYFESQDKDETDGRTEQVEPAHLAASRAKKPGGPPRRIRPGAALANAPRQKVGIVRGSESMNKKIVFD